jgi:hypothetical protein
MEIEVIAKGRNMRYDAVGMYDGKGLTVLKGSRISATMASKMNPVAVKLRARKDTVDDGFVLQRDVTFRSASTAASFVTGSIANGMRVWKLKDGKPLSNLQEK